MARIDILLDNNLDLMEDGDDWAEGECGEIDVELITLATKGDNKEFPFSGFAARERIGARLNKQQFISDYTNELTNDGFKNVKIIMGDTIGDTQVQISD